MLEQQLHSKGCQGQQIATPCLPGSALALQSLGQHILCSTSSTSSNCMHQQAAIHYKTAFQLLKSAWRSLM
jgi:hypothetical protein